jgi:outer membrane lipopolysaccharide assembly protein LptE/RlpB
MQRSVLAVLAVAGLALVTTGCGQQMRAERDARDLADAICDLRNADDADAANEALDDINAQLDDLSRRFGVATAEDRADVDENLADLAEHAVQGNEVLLQQDLAVLQRSAENIRDDASGVQQAAWSGFADGVRECIED